MNLLEEEATEYQLGDLLNVKGRLSYYRDQWQLFGNIIRKWGKFKKMLPVINVVLQV